jgi:hypothetical protein
VKHSIALAIASTLALTSVATPALPAAAADLTDLARKNCTKYILARTDVNSSTIRTFQVVKTGDGYEMTGYNEEKQMVKCSAAQDAHVTWVRVG